MSHDAFVVVLLLELFCVTAAATFAAGAWLLGWRAARRRKREEQEWARIEQLATENFLEGLEVERLIHEAVRRNTA